LTKLTIFKFIDFAKYYYTNVVPILLNAKLNGAKQEKLRFSYNVY